MNKDIAKKLHITTFNDSDAYTNYLFDKLFPSNYFCIKENDSLIAQTFIMYKKIVFYNKIIDIPYIYSLCVEEKYQHQGYGTKLLKKVLNKLANYPFVVLLTDITKFYTNNGFVVVQDLYIDRNIPINSNIIDFNELLRIYKRKSSSFEIYGYRDIDYYIEYLNELNMFNEAIYVNKDCYKTNDETVLLNENKVKPNMHTMFRICNINKMLKLFIYNEPINLTLNIKDDIIKTNNINIKLVNKNTTLTLSKCSTNNDIIDISKLSSIIFDKSYISDKFKQLQIKPNIFFIDTR